MQLLLLGTVTMSLAFSLACARQREERPLRAEESECTQSTFSQVLATDTARLTRVDFEDLVSESSEGLILSAYYDNSDPRVLGPAQK